MTKKRFYSNGKLLLTAEYLVLEGVKSLALPTKFGQDLVIENRVNHEINWKGFDYDGTVWFEANVSFNNIIKNIKSENQSILNTLVEILHQAYLLNPSFLNQSEGYTISTHLTFPRIWGLGTSSTLINNIAQWLEIDAFELLKISFGGSGYDIACAQNHQAIIYQIVNAKPIIQPVIFNPKCVENLYFVYLNQKQSSKEAIASFYKNHKKENDALEKINSISESILTDSSFESFSRFINEHESIMSSVLNIPTVKSRLFPDFKGSIKSLGAWGGDFILVVSDRNPTAYFKQKGYDTILTYNDIII